MQTNQQYYLVQFLIAVQIFVTELWLLVCIVELIGWDNLTKMFKNGILYKETQ